MSPSSVATAALMTFVCCAVIPPTALRVSAYPSAPPPSTRSAAPAARTPLPTLASELVGLRAGRRIRLDAHDHRVLPGLDRDLLRDRRGALLAPRGQLVLPGREPLERELALRIGHDIRRRGHH